MVAFMYARSDIYIASGSEASGQPSEPPRLDPFAGVKSRTAEKTEKSGRRSVCS